jgi:hypothetical protein
LIDLPVVDSNIPKTNPLTLYLARLALSSQLTMRYVLQDAADRLDFEDVNIEEIPWHQLQPEDVIALVATLRADGYAPNTSPLYVNAVRGDERGVAHEPDQPGTLAENAFGQGIAGTRLSCGRNSPDADPGTDGSVSPIRRPQGLRDAAIIGTVRLGHAQIGIGEPGLNQIDFTERSLRVTKARAINS